MSSLLFYNNARFKWHNDEPPEPDDDKWILGILKFLVILIILIIYKKYCT